MFLIKKKKLAKNWLRSNDCCLCKIASKYITLIQQEEVGPGVGGGWEEWNKETSLDLCH